MSNDSTGSFYNIYYFNKRKRYGSLGTLHNPRHKGTTIALFVEMLGAAGYYVVTHNLDIAICNNHMW